VAPFKCKTRTTLIMIWNPFADIEPFDPWIVKPFRLTTCGSKVLLSTSEATCSLFPCVSKNIL
jgi:hypothetical protein